MKRRDNAILLFTGLSPRHMPHPPWGFQRGLREGMVARTGDLIRIATSSCASISRCCSVQRTRLDHPATGAAYRLAFPDCRRDIARAGYETCGSLKNRARQHRDRAVMGGMVVLAYAAQFPGATGELISISGCRASPFAIACDRFNARAILRDPDWRGGRLHQSSHPRRNAHRRKLA